MNDIMARTFLAWLRTQRSRDDRVGDIARDVASDRRDGWRGRTIETLLDRMSDLNASDDAIDSLAIAVCEWITRRGAR